MKNIKTIFLAITILTSFALNAQVAINTDGSPADNSAMLDVKSTEKGFLPPRMTEAEISNISNPANGLLVFNTDDSKVYVFVSAESKWKALNYGSSTIDPFVCGSSFIDSRDSKSYTTVLIGTQCWMAENLNIGSRINSITEQTNNSVIEKYCYDNNEAYCDTYGGFYQWDEMMQYVTTEGVQGICPSGWHIPTHEEWPVLEGSLGGYEIAGGKMKETGTVHWNSPNTGATNSSGFTGLPSGGRHPDGSFLPLGQYGHMWSSSESSDTYAWDRILGDSYGELRRFYYKKIIGLSVRCLKD